jgi:hypothetical protein
MSQSSDAPLSERQRAVLSEIAGFRRANGYDCTVTHLAKRLGCHHSTIQQHLDYAHRKGYLRAPVPGPLVRPLPPMPALPIPPRDEDDGPSATIEERTVTAPGLPEPARLELRTLSGQSRPSTVIVRTRTRTRRMDVLREGGPDGPITGFEVVEEVEG